MTAIWHDDGTGWQLLAPSGFPDEAALHSLVEQAPHVLPLAGSPMLTIVGREVPLGSGYADLVGIELAGRLAVIEVKLARNAEARRAVVSQVLAYAAYLASMDPSVLERDVLGRYLREHGHETLAAAILEVDQRGIFDLDTFTSGLAESLGEGRFRLVLVLDAAPEELVRLVGYLESVTDKLVIDLVTVSAYEVAGMRFIVPQRVEPERQVSRPPSGPMLAKTEGRYVEGADDFAAAIEQSAEDQRPLLKRLCDWAIRLEQEGLVRLGTYHGKGRMTLLPRLKDEDAGLVTIWNDRGAYLSFWRTVFVRRAPGSIERVESIIAPKTIGSGNTTRDVTDELVAALTDAYREAAMNARSKLGWSLHPGSPRLGTQAQ